MLVKITASSILILTVLMIRAGFRKSKPSFPISGLAGCGTAAPSSGDALFQSCQYHEHKTLGCGQQDDRRRKQQAGYSVQSADVSGIL